MVSVAEKGTGILRNTSEKSKNKKQNSPHPADKTVFFKNVLEKM